MSIKVGPHTYAIEWHDEVRHPDGSTLWGKRDPTQQTFELDNKLRDLPTQRVDTILHEITHELLYQLAMTHKLKESDVHRFACAFAGALLDNNLLNLDMLDERLGLITHDP